MMCAKHYARDSSGNGSLIILGMEALGQRLSKQRHVYEPEQRLASTALTCIRSSRRGCGGLTMTII
jgi:hypothetical protein